MGGSRKSPGWLDKWIEKNQMGDDFDEKSKIYHDAKEHNAGGVEAFDGHEDKY